MVTGRRDTTTVATQALYLLNDPFVRQQGAALAQRLLSRKDLDGADRTTLAYRLALGRLPTAAERQRANGYVLEYETAARAERPNPPSDLNAAAWTSLCHAILASAEFRYVR